jgi:hypothetical protein
LFVIYSDAAYCALKSTCATELQGSVSEPDGALKVIDQCLCGSGIEYMKVR